MKTNFQKRGRKGLIFIHAMTLWRNQEILSGMAATDSHQVSMGGVGNSQNPCQMPRRSCNHG